MTKQLVSIILFMCTISVTINAFGKVDAYVAESASYLWTDSDLDNIIPDENYDLFSKPHSYFAYSIHDNEDSKYTNKEDKNVVEEVVVPLSKLVDNSSNGNETEKSEEISKKEFMNDMHLLINAIIEESDTEDRPFKEEEEEQQQEQEDEKEVEVSVPLLDEELTFDPMEEIELFSLTVPETQKEVTENKPHKEMPSVEPNPLLLSPFLKESSNEGFFMSSKNDDSVRNEKSIIPFLRTNENGVTGEIILEMNLFPLDNKAPFPEHRSTYHTDLPQEKPLLPFLFSSRLPDTTVAHSWQSLIYPSSKYIHHSSPSTNFYSNPNRVHKDINPRKILNSLKATSIGKMEYQPLEEHLFSSPIGCHDSSHIFDHSPYHNGDISHGSLDLGLLNGGISINNLRKSKYTHKNPHAILPSVDAVTQLGVIMNPSKRIFRKMMVIEPPAVLHIEPVICHHAYEHPQTHVVF